MEANEKVKNEFETLSEEVRILIQSMLNPNPRKRPTISQVLEYSWLSKSFPCNITEDVFIEMSYRKEHIMEYYKNMKVVKT